MPGFQCATCFQCATYRKNGKSGGTLANFKKTKYFTPMNTLRHKQPVSRARAGYQAANLEAATIIAADPVKYPVGGLMQEWADVILSRAAAPPADWEAGPLFQQRAA